MSEDKKTLYQYLQDNLIVIPKIQRDYAQGRRDKVAIRDSILNELHQVLEEDGKTLTLDFIYGTTVKDNEKKVISFMPLDGQQRLTTLWLLHWFVSFKSENLKYDANYLKKFSYETRSSSREFVQALCEKMQDAKLAKDETIANYIQRQSWFYNEWKYDSTISSMLRMISGDKRGDTACIEGKFGGKETQKYEDFRDALHDNSKKKICFTILEIDEKQVPVPDRLYIKMNARGKRLSDFENFRAGFLKHIKEDVYKGDTGEQNEGLNPFKISKLLDGEWTDTIWDWAKNGKKKGSNKKESNEGKFNGYIDGLFFSFINRLVLNEVIIKSFNEKGKKEKIEDNERFKKLYGSNLAKNSPDDRLITYDGFGVYKDYITKDFVHRLNTIMKGLKDDKPKDDNRFREILLPLYDEKDKDYRGNFLAASTTQSERCKILACCTYLNWEVEGDKDRAIFDKWRKITDYLIDNSYIDTIDGMTNCIKEINALGEHIKDSLPKKENGVVYDLYNCIQHYKPVNNTTNNVGKQIEEEVEKAKAICANKMDMGVIEAAEEFSFFNGSIRFLVDEKDDKTGWDWDEDKFKKRMENAKKLFSKEQPQIPVETYKKFFIFLYEKEKEKAFECTISPEVIDGERKNFKREYMQVYPAIMREFLSSNIKEEQESKPESEEYWFFNTLISPAFIKDYVFKEEPGRYRIEVKKQGDLEVCYFYKVSQNSTSYIFVNKNHQKWSKELHCMAETKDIEVESRYYDEKIGYFGKNINIKIGKETYTWSKENEKEKGIFKNVLTLKGEDNKRVEWNEEEGEVSIVEKLEDYERSLEFRTLP